jgi:hypothetical protein
MNDILEILKYILPSIVVLLTAVILIKLLLRNEDKRRSFEFSMAQRESVSPLRLQAYERLILLLERISPDSIVMRLNTTELNVQQLQNELLQSIRKEFDHNIAQQTYVSIAAWEKIKKARADITLLINTSAAELKPGDNGVLLSKQILENAIKVQKPPALEAINFLKQEVRDLF